MQTIFIVVLVPIVVHLVINRLLRSRAIRNYTPEQVRQFRSMVYPLSYRWIAIGSYAGVFLSIVGAAAAAVLGARTNWLADLLKTMLTPDAVYFNPQPGILLMLFSIFWMVLTGGLFITTWCQALLPPRMQAYLATVGKSNTNQAVMRPEARLISKITLWVYSIAVVFLAATIPLYTAVNERGISHVGTYPLHTEIPLSFVQSFTVSCQVQKGHTDYQTHVAVTAQTGAGDVTILAMSDGQLPTDYTHTLNPTALYRLAAQHHIPVIKQDRPECSEVARQWGGSALEQYNEYFSQ